ncbi:hypothetical protein ACFVZG_48900, partial [Streptomyces sp. NPDC058296]
MLAGLGTANTNAYHDAASAAFTDRPMDEAMTTVCLTLVATDEQDRTIGVLSATAPGTVIDMATNHGYTLPKAMSLSLFIAKVHGLAVAEHARGQNIAVHCSSGPGRSTTSSATCCCTARTKPTAIWEPSTPAAPQRLHRPRPWQELLPRPRHPALRPRRRRRPVHVHPLAPTPLT